MWKPMRKQAQPQQSKVGVYVMMSTWMCVCVCILQQKVPKQPTGSLQSHKDFNDLLVGIENGC